MISLVGAGIFSSLFDNKKSNSKKAVDLCVLGLDNSGKTTILKALSNEEI